jgi:hypothetical protein
MDGTQQLFRGAGLRAPMALVLACAVAAPVSILLAAAGESPHPPAVLTVLCAAAFAVGLRAGDLLGSALAGLVFWLFYDGFDAHRWGVLSWDGRTDATRLGLLVAAGVLGALVRRLRDAPLLRRR